MNGIRRLGNTPKPIRSGEVVSTVVHRETQRRLRICSEIYRGCTRTDCDFFLERAVTGVGKWTVVALNAGGDQDDLSVSVNVNLHGESKCDLLLITLNNLTVPWPQCKNRDVLCQMRSSAL